MSRERFNELVEGYALGELDHDEAREFLKLVEDNHDWAREAQETREFARIARAVPPPSAPAGLVAGALREARSRKQDPTTPMVDVLRPSADVILIPGPNGKMRRIPIHGQQKSRDEGIVDPHEGRHRFHINWSFMATAAAILILGGLVAMEIGPNLVGRARTQQARDEEDRYLASSTRYELENRITRGDRTTAAPAAPIAGTDAMAAAEATPTPDLRALLMTDSREASASTSSAGEVARVAQEAEGAPRGRDVVSDEAPVEVAMAAPATESFARKAEAPKDIEVDQDAAKQAASEFTSVEAMGLEPEAAAANELAEAMPEVAEEEPDEQKLFMARFYGEPEAPATESPEVEVAAQSVDLGAAASTAVEVASVPAPPQRLLTTLEADFLLAQAKIAGGNLAETPGAGAFGALPLEGNEGKSSREISFLFPDRAAYDVFVTRLRIMPLDDLSQSPQGERAVASGWSASAGDEAERRQRNGIRGGFGPGNGATPSPVTGFASTQPAPATRPAAQVNSEMVLSEETGLDAAAETAALPEGLALGQPINLALYHFHLTTDLETGTLRLTLRPVQTGEKAGGPPSPRSFSPAPGSRR
jgi:hypothetical protein